MDSGEAVVLGFFQFVGWVIFFSLLIGIFVRIGEIFVQIGETNRLLATLLNRQLAEPTPQAGAFRPNQHAAVK